MNNKKIKPRKSKIETSASMSDLIKSKKTKIEISTSVSDLIKSKTANSIKLKKPKMADLIKPRKRASSSNLDSSQHNSAPDENKDNDEYIYYNEEEENDDNEDDGDEDDGDEDDGDEDDGDEDDGDENNGAENNGGEDEGDYNEEEDDDDDGDDEEEEEDIEEFFSSPEIGNDEVFVMESLNDSIETEIILWVFKFQQRFRLPDIALEVLIKFLYIVLTRLDKSQFKNFPASLYLAKKMLNIFQPKMQLAVCNNCHKLYNVRNIVEYKEEGKAAIANCLHEEFPDNPVPSRRNKCNNPLSILKKRKGEIIAVPRMIYPKPSIRQQLSMLYQRPGFEDMLELSGIQRGGVNTYSDIYDGKVWKTFPFNGDTFFTPETATTHLALSLILIGFNLSPILNTVLVLFTRFLPGPKEVRLERINHYLAPIVDELLELWKGWRVPKTYQYTEGLDIKVALIIGSSDTPATRKLFGHGSAVMKCHRCEKRSTYSEVYKKTHYGGMQEYDKWVTNPINPSLHRQYAHEWLQCNSKSSRDTHFKEHGVRWSELLRLPYMDPIRFAVVDPMHCLFLGIAKWIIKSIFINQNKLSMEQLRIAQKRMDYIELPSDIGRIPPKIAIGNEGFSNLTADQWKTFIMIYSTPILWDMLDNNDRKILGHFVRACNLLVARFITEDDLREAQERLKDMAHLIERTYGPEFITSNIHLALHIPNCCRDYGSIYSFWLFPYERLNGYIDYHLSYKWSSGLLKESLSLIMPKQAVGSLAFTAEKDELQHFLSMRHNTSTFSKIYGTERLPGQMLNPSCFKVIIPLELRRFLCEWYSILYEKEQNEILGFMDLVIDQHARLQIGAEIFGSMISGHQEKNVTILAKWKASNDDSVDIYPGDVQYYFEHTLRLPEGPRKHLLAYVKWYKSAPSSDIRFKHRFIEPEISNTELWQAEYFQEGCDSIIAVHRILCRATKFKSVCVGKRKYLSIIPLNRKFNL
ncbi:uncharacterized protein LOC114543330 [Rhizophagus irregularis DAOM 181602=DAOM 197198]|nr:uncharacterized protein LOC114543330 [Rhizophagus irregularis DAOM 181602=DAOM 197198]